MISASFEEDLRACKGGGAQGIGICEAKFPDNCTDRVLVEKFHASGLKAAVCLPAVLSILPLPKFPGPSDPQARVEAMIGGIRRLARFEPACCFCLTGPRGGLDPGRARDIVVTGLRKAARAAADVGVRLAVEPIHSAIQADWTIVSTIPETLTLIDEVNEPNLGIGFDTWHLGETPNVLEQIRNYATRITGVHISDRRDPTRGWADRVFPGDGTLHLRQILGALERGGYQGWYDLEVLSDNGTFDADYPDSLWKLPPEELVRRGRDSFMRVWKARRN
jgi:sugar phosphate isomerase/epimerase